MTNYPIKQFKGERAYSDSQLQGMVHHGSRRLMHLVVLNPQSGSREREMLLLSAFSLFHSVQDPSNRMVPPIFKIDPVTPVNLNLDNHSQVTPEIQFCSNSSLIKFVVKINHHQCLYSPVSDTVIVSFFTFLPYLLLFSCLRKC